MEQGQLVRKKKRRHSKKGWFIIPAAILLILLPPVGIYLYNLMYGTPSPVAVAPAKPVQPAPPSVEQVPVEEPETAASEIRGKWYGLCKKNVVKTIEDFRVVVGSDPVLTAHFADFDWVHARSGNLEEAIWTPVSYRKGDTIAKTKKKIKLPKGDGYITDGKRRVRTYCCNDYVIDAPPTEVQNQPLMEKIDNPVRRQEMVAGPPAQQSSNAPAQASAGPPGPPPKLVLPPVPKVIFIPNVPEPSSLLLMATGVGGFGLLRWLKRRKP